MAWRPIEFNQEYIDKAKAYLETCKDTYNDKDKLKVKLPSIEWLCRHFHKEDIAVHRSTIYDWKDKYPEFSDILEQILIEQAERLINSSISWEYNSNIAKLLMGKHWYTEKTETEHSWSLSIGSLLSELQWQNTNT